MVYISKVTTKTGDTGTSYLPGVGHIAKNSLIFHALGDIDELNSVVGILIYHANTNGYSKLLTNIQNDLFDVGSHLCTYREKDSKCRITQEYVDRLDKKIEEINEKLDPIKSFVLPGGSLSGSYCHLARSVCRRAERSTWAAIINEQMAYEHSITAKYLNRLSDLLFVLARAINKQSMQEVLWKPGEAWKD